MLTPYTVDLVTQSNLTTQHRIQIFYSPKITVEIVRKGYRLIQNNIIHIVYASAHLNS